MNILYKISGHSGSYPEHKRGHMKPGGMRKKLNLLPRLHRLEIQKKNERYVNRLIGLTYNPM